MQAMLLSLISVLVPLAVTAPLTSLQDISSRNLEEKIYVEELSSFEKREPTIYVNNIGLEEEARSVVYGPSDEVGEQAAALGLTETSIGERQSVEYINNAPPEVEERRSVEYINNAPPEVEVPRSFKYKVDDVTATEPRSVMYGPNGEVGEQASALGLSETGVGERSSVEYINNAEVEGPRSVQDLNNIGIIERGLEVKPAGGDFAEQM